MDSLPAIRPQMSGHGSSIPDTETELHKLLIDERMRYEHHKTNYQTLKEEHTRLQTDYIKSQNDYKQMLAEKHSTHDKFQHLLAELQGELLDKTREVMELKLQILTPQKMEQIRIQIQQEVEAQMLEHFRKLNEDSEKYRIEYNKIRYENSVLTSQFEHQKVEHIHVLEEQKIKYEAEILQLEKDKDELQNQIRSVDPTRDSKRVESLLRENSALTQELKDLKAEVKELRAEREHYGVQAESVQRIQVQRMSETQAAIRSLEAEKQSVKLHIEHLEKEVQVATEQNDILTKKLHRAEREVHTLTSKVEELKHYQKLEIANIKLEAARTKNEAEKDKDMIQNQLDGIVTENGILKAALERHKELLAEKDRELTRKVQAAKEAGFQQLASIEDERLKLENRVVDLEKYKETQDQQKQSEISQMEEKLHIVQLAEEAARRELQSLRSKLQQQMAYTDQMKKEKHDEAELKQEIKELRIQVASLSESENKLLHENEKLRQMVERLKHENRSARNQAEKAQQDAEKELEGGRIEWLQEKHKLQENLSHLQEKYNQIKGKLTRAAVAQKKRKTINENKCKKLQDKVELLEAKNEELETEKAVLNKQNIPQAEYVRLQKRLKDLQRRLNEFRTVILGPNVAPSGFLIPVSYLSSTIVPGAEISFHNAQEEQHQRELSMLRKRLEELEINQMKQLEELGPPTERSKLESSGSGHSHGNVEEEEISEAVDSKQP